MAFLSSLNIAASGMSAQRFRLDVIAQNIANSQTTKTEDGTPYVRQCVVFSENKSFDKVLASKMSIQSKYGSAANNTSGVSGALSTVDYKGVLATDVVEDETPLTPVYDPTNPNADENGYYYMPNVDVAEEELDALAATRSYEANLTVLNAVKSMAQKALSIGN